MYSCILRESQHHIVHTVAHCNTLQQVFMYSCILRESQHHTALRTVRERHSHRDSHHVTCAIVCHDFTCCECRCVCVAVCCRVLQCVAECCSMLQCAAVCCSVLQCVAVRCRTHFDTYMILSLSREEPKRGVVCCSVLQRVAACCSVLQCDAEHCRTHCDT